MVATAMGKRVGAREVPLEIHSPDLPLPTDVGEYIHAKLNAKLSKFGERVIEVVVHIKDLNGAQRGGEDKQCHVEAYLAACVPANVEERHHDLRAAIDLAVDRLARTIERHLQRRRARRRPRQSSLP